MTLTQTVHVQAQGLTSFLNLYAWGATPQEAEMNGRAYLLGNGIEVQKFHGTSPAQQQDPKRYTFPEQIYGLALERAVEAIESNGWPESIVTDTLTTLRKKRGQLRTGLELLQEHAAT